ncbi:MAG: 16S rRNA (guanine(966)-N(2))-methyltransferase RsmD [Verrucomicrobiae bacterium]|nr:16S rRNA (guanine(966)-N(2))-methyltransferase RsmD [Verrucomicrobiae bacterium]
MRVTGGAAARLLLKVPRHPGLRPTQDRVRESLFGMLAPHLPDARVLDLYSGTGAFAIEALSRGAARAVLVETHRACLDAIRENLRHTGLAQQATLVPRDALAFLRDSRDTFDIVLADPPYQKCPSGDTGPAPLLPAVARRLAPGGLFVLEFFAPNRPPDPAPFALTRERRYGNTGIWILQLPSPPPA